MRRTKNVERAYRLAHERYAEMGVNTDDAMAALARISLSIHCWQGDDVGGFEKAGQELGAGLAVTGNYPGKARTPDELRSKLREQGVEDLTQVKRALMESNGEISVIRLDGAETDRDRSARPA